MPPQRNPDLDSFGLPPTISSAALAHLSGLTTKRLDQMITDARITPECKVGRSLWATEKTLRELFSYYRRRLDTARPQEDKDVAAQTEIEDLRAKRLKNAKMARDLLPRRVYIEVWGELLTTFKNRWLSFPEKMGIRCHRAADKVESTEILRKEVADIFAGLNDPRVMEEISNKIRDDEFEDSEASDDMVTGNTEGLSQGHTGLPGTSA